MGPPPRTWRAGSILNANPGKTENEDQIRYSTSGFEEITAMTLSVYLADLRHDYTGVLSNDCMPLGVGYLKAVMDRELPEVKSRLFAYPGHLAEALRSQPPDVLMLSNYMWNEQLSLRIARLAKSLRPEMLVIMGGPNISIESDRKIAYMEAHPELDLYVLGEGDFLATEVLKIYLEVGLDRAKLGARDIPSSLFRRDGRVEISSMRARHRELNEIPSPWLTGIPDEFFDGSLAAMSEANRGSPRR